MELEYTFNSATAKSKAADSLRAAGFGVSAGPIRLAYPFTLMVTLAEDTTESVRGILREIDPCAGRVLAPLRATAPVH